MVLADRKSCVAKTLQYLMGHSGIGVTLNTYVILDLENAMDELHRMKELENARKELEISKEDSQIVPKQGKSEHFRRKN